MNGVSKKKISRRQFIKAGGALLGTTPFLGKNVFAKVPEEVPYELSKPENQLYSVCLQCNTGCPVKVKVLDGIAAKIDGSPYSPWTMWPHIPYKTDLETASRIDGSICPKGQAGIQTTYDPYRIRKCLKRAGRRGENKWITIPFEQAVSEIVNGGKLFEDDRVVEGLKDIFALKDPKAAKDMGAFVKEIWHEKDADAKKKKIEEFKERFKSHLDTLIDPDHPDLGPKNNQLLWIHGRLKAGRSEFFKRFVQESFGSVNFHGHTTVCQGSLYFTGKAMSEQFDFDEKDKKAKWTGGKKFYWQADLSGSEFVVFVGASIFEANYGPPYRAQKVTRRVVDGKLKYVVIDPRFSKLAAKAWKWLPARPGTEGAVALSLIKLVIDNKRYNEAYLACANKGASKERKEPNWANACWLVKLKDGKPSDFLRASDLGKEKTKKTGTLKDGSTVEYELDNFVCVSNGEPQTFDPNDAENSVFGDLFFDGELNGIKVKTALQVLKEEADKHSVEEWAEISGVKASDLVEIAQEFTSHGRRSCADIHRGVSQHTNGYYNVLGWYSLNLLIGNFDWQGGMAQASTYNHAGDKDGKPFDLTKLHPKKISPFGIGIIRDGVKYEETTIFNDYPAKRPFFPLASDVYQEIIPSAGDAYPYPIKAIIMYMATPGYSLPAGNTNIEILADTKKTPLFIASDITIGETTMYADYIIPDISYLERWEFHGSHPSIIWKVQPIRQPVVVPLTEIVKVFGEEIPISLEAFFLAVAEKMGLPGFGKNGLAEGMDLIRPEDYYLKMAANVAFGDEKDGSKAVPDADDKEIKIFLESRRHLPKTVFEPDKWQKASGELWKKVVYVLNRGGRFDDFDKAFDGEQLKNKYAKQINMYCEKTAKTKNSMTGKSFSGIAAYLPIADCLGNLIEDEKEGYNLKLITYREISQTKSRTIGNYWLLTLLPENFILINVKDAEGLGIKDGDKVRVLSKSNPEGEWDLKGGGKKPLTGRVKAIQGIRPGVVAFSLGHGHWAYGARDVWVNGEVIKQDNRRGTGIHANAAMRIDPYLKNTCLEDLVGASVAFYDSYVKLVKA